MIDLISRQAAIDVIDAILPVEPMKNEYTQGITCGAALAIEYVKQLPSARRWIPVSERLPKPDEEVFVYLWGNVPHLASVNSEGQWETDQFYLDADDTPKAWMPLPEPWKGEE